MHQTILFFRTSVQADVLSLGSGVPEYFDCEFPVYDCMVFSDQDQVINQLSLKP